MYGVVFDIEGFEICVVIQCLCMWVFGVYVEMNLQYLCSMCMCNGGVEQMVGNIVLLVCGINKYVLQYGFVCDLCQWFVMQFGNVNQCWFGKCIEDDLMFGCLDVVVGVFQCVF